MAVITYWHNPRCSKSRAGLALLEEHGAEVVVRRYLEDAPAVAELRAVLVLLGCAPIEMMRPCEPQFKALGLGRESAAEDLLAAMAAHPILIERPIAIGAARAVIGRPPEAVLGVL
ncbi:arsenate reductase [Roseovarius sp. TM1035]|jgi:arsenate reductase|uniref:arsenate reductase (glutaredoxin) n=1 Tax=Roseovarius TaxID=74030 RepID=UPI000155685C|nr:arsenate reductase (glutaredoxin) [Roseovarius sp. TM1035]AWZ19424.1 Arsenate reductase [Roseovarius sp. AK1035]EDM33599.1 arsenate reductase [Roseovarius sp. TM1035]|tara:strand:- start:83 stop:430 length:348 start_codon:yes stop_codon:yes gene_type:complete